LASGGTPRRAKKGSRPAGSGLRFGPACRKFVRREAARRPRGAAGENAKTMLDEEVNHRKSAAAAPPWAELLASEELLQLAIRDPLTGLLNRRAFDEALRWFWRQGREQPLPVGLLILDIDHFKAVNDSYGHVVGDQFLKECATLAKNGVRESDIVCRYYGGDELVAILPDADEAETRRIATRLLESFREAVLCRDTYELRATVSIGACAMTAGAGHGAETFLIQADRALYRAKQTGRNQVCFAGDPPPAAPVPAHRPAAPAGSLDTQRGVLVVDDDRSLCVLFQRMLTRERFGVFIAETSEAALEIARRERGMIDVALVDLHIGEENGLDLLKQLRGIDESTIGVVITGQATLENAVASLQQGAYDFVQKPVAPAQLTAVLERAAKYRRLVLENKRYQLHLEEMVREKNAALSRALDQITDSYQFTLEAMADMLDTRERKTGAHSKRVARMAVVLARKLGASLEEIEIIGTGALLHDIGKIGIPDAILLKEGPLTDEEREIMKTHPHLGYNVIKAGPGLEPASEIVLAHQERFDGSGYPRGLKGEDICLGARIFAVVDAYDAIRSDRPYSRGRGAAETLAEIVRHSGTQFDPAVVAALRSCQAEIEDVGRWPAP